MTVSYSSYLKLDELLALQQPRSAGPEHDEMLFIVIHQVYELWFKEMLHELGYLEKLLRDNDTPRALHTLKRILTVLKVIVESAVCFRQTMAILALWTLMKMGILLELLSISPQDKRTRYCGLLFPNRVQ